MRHPSPLLSFLLLALVAALAFAPHARALRSTRQLVNGMPLQAENQCELDSLDVVGNSRLTASGTPAASMVGEPPSDFKIAFVGDMGTGPRAEAMARFMREEGAEMLVHAGGLGTDSSEPGDFYDMVLQQFANYKVEVPVVTALGAEDFATWSAEEAIEEAGRFADNMGTCSGIHGVRQVCTHRGVTVVSVSPGAFGCHHARFVRESFAKHPSMWRVCVFHQTQQHMQVSGLSDSAGWDVYEECRKAGAITVTGNNHAYARSYEMNSTTHQGVVSKDAARPIELRPEGMGRPGSNFVAVVGTGGSRLDSFEDTPYRHLPHWAVTLADSTVTDPHLQHGALFCTLGAGGSPRVGRCYFKERESELVRDEFELASVVDRSDGEQELRLQVASRLDNAFQRVVSSTCDFNDQSGMPLGVDPESGEAVLTALRFEHFPLDRATLDALGTSIVEAYLEFVPVGTLTTEGTLAASVLDADTAPPPCGTDYATDENRTGRVPWPAWSAEEAAGGVVRSADIKELLDLVLARPGFEANNAVTLFINGTVARGAAAYDQDHGCCEAPTLVVRLAPHLHVANTALDVHGPVQINCGPPGECSCNPAHREAPRFVSGTPGPVDVATPPPVNYTVAFLANGGVGPHPREVLERVRERGADLVVNAGNLLGHTRGTHTLEEWRAQLEAAGLGSVPHLWTPGPNDVDEDGEPNTIAAAMYDDLNALGTCYGPVGENTVCTRDGLTVVLVSPNLAGCDHAEYIEWAFAAHPSMWRVCAFYESAGIFDVGRGEGHDEVLPVYEACRRAGALIVTGGSHTYARSYTMSSTAAPGVAQNTDPARALVLSEEVEGENADTSKHGTTAVLAVGLGGESRGSYNGLNYKSTYWARTLAQADAEEAETGAVLCRLNVNGMEDLAHCERVTRNGDVTDAFWLRTTAGELPIDWQVRLQVRAAGDDVEQVEELSEDGKELVEQRCGSRDLEIVDDERGEAMHQIVGLRFEGFPLSDYVLDQLRTQTEGAWLEFAAYGDANRGAPNLFVNVHGDRDWNPDDLCGDDIRNRDWTDAATAWHEEQAWDVAFELHRSPDMKHVVDEMLSAPRWVAGGAASFFIVGNGTRSAASFDLNCCLAPTLVVQMGPPNVDFSAYDPYFYYNATGHDSEFPVETPDDGDSDSDSDGGAAGAAISSSRFLELALRLQEMTQIATVLTNGDILEPEAVKELDQELKSIEGEIADDAGSTARDLRSMVSVVRGTLYQHSETLSDEEVEALGGNSFTYANPRYWEDYYNKTSSDEKFDWYGSWDTPVVFEGAAAALADVLRPRLTPESRILMLGCGNSDLSEKMYLAGYENIVNVDISSHVLDLLRARLQQAMPKMSWTQMNVNDLTFADGEFDVVLDKGTLDAIEANKPLTKAASSEVHRVLRPGGQLLSVTFNDAVVRVEGQLRPAAEWGDCSTLPFERAAKRAGEEGSRFFLHACAKRM